jgi:hypothetical protein
VVSVLASQPRYVVKKRDRKELGRYVRAVADEMGLRDWTLNLEVDSPDTPDGAPDGMRWGASCEPVPGRKAATITFDPCHREAQPEDLRETVVHELTHCHFFGVWDTIRRDLLRSLGQDSYDLFTAGVERHMEYGIDAIAEVIAKQMPLIEWPKRKG